MNYHASAPAHRDVVNANRLIARDLEAAHRRLAAEVLKAIAVAYHQNT